MRTIAFDIGDVRTGAALSDPDGILASALSNIPSENQDALAGEIVRLAETNQAGEIVLGNPLKMSGEASPQSEKVELIAAAIRKNTKIPVILWDERLTTKMATSFLIEGRERRKDRKQKVDKVAAVLILQSYLDFKKARQNA